MKISEVKNIVKVLVKESKQLNEGKWSKIMKGVREGDQMGPWAIIIFKNNKFITQRLVKVRDAIPAHYEDIKKMYPNHNLSIEDASGQIVYTENI